MHSHTKLVLTSVHQCQYKPVCGQTLPDINCLHRVVKCYVSLYGGCCSLWLMLFSLWNDVTPIVSFIANHCYITIIWCCRFVVNGVSVCRKPGSAWRRYIPQLTRSSFILLLLTLWFQLVTVTATMRQSLMQNQHTICVKAQRNYGWYIFLHRVWKKRPTVNKML